MKTIFGFMKVVEYKKLYFPTCSIGKKFTEFGNGRYLSRSHLTIIESMGIQVKIINKEAKK